MKIEDFYQLDNFHVDELDTAGRPIVAKLSVVEEALMLKLDAAVTTAKESFGNEAGRFHVHCIVLGGHKPGSQHGLGRAVDGHFEDLDLYQSVMVGLKAGFTGIGFYPWWNSPGIHFDIREQNHVSTWASLYKGQYKYEFDLFTDRLSMYADT